MKVLRDSLWQFTVISEHNCTQTVLDISADTIANQNKVVIMMSLFLSTKSLCPLLK